MSRSEDQFYDRLWKIGNKLGIPSDMIGASSSYFSSSADGRVVIDLPRRSTGTYVVLEYHHENLITPRYISFSTPDDGIAEFLLDRVKDVPKKYKRLFNSAKLRALVGTSEKYQKVVVRTAKDWEAFDKWIYKKLGIKNVINLITKENLEKKYVEAVKKELHKFGYDSKRKVPDDVIQKLKEDKYLYLIRTIVNLGAANSIWKARGHDE